MARLVDYQVTSKRYLTIRSQNWLIPLSRKFGLLEHLVTLPSLLVETNALRQPLFQPVRMSFDTGRSLHAYSPHRVPAVRTRTRQGLRRRHSGRSVRPL